MKKAIFIVLSISVIALPCMIYNGFNTIDADFLKNKINDIIPKNHLNTLRGPG